MNRVDQGLFFLKKKRTHQVNPFATDSVKDNNFHIHILVQVERHINTSIIDNTTATLRTATTSTTKTLETFPCIDNKKEKPHTKECNP